MPDILQLDWLHRPLNVIGTLTDRVLSGAESSTEEDMGVKTYFANILNVRENAEMVPVLTAANAELLRPGTLVRVKGMVHHSFDRRYCLCKGTAILPSGAKKPVCGLYKSDLDLPDGAQVDPHGVGNTFIAQTELYITPIPGQSDWATEMNSGTSVQKCEEKIPETGIYQTTQTPPAMSSKRQLSGQDEDEHAVQGMDEDMDGDAVKRKKLAELQEGVVTRTDTKSDLKEKEDVADAGECVYEEVLGAVVVTLYGNADDLPINSIVNVYGVLCEPTPTMPVTPAHDNEMIMFSELDATAGPPNSIPRLQAVTVQSVISTNPIVNKNPTPQNHMTQELASTSRALVLDILSDALRGDRVAAEYMLMHLLSSSPTSKQTTTAGQGPRVGRISLNLFGACDTLMLNNLREIISALTPASVVVPLVVDTLNTVKYWPVQDAQSQRLRKSLLQVAPNITHIIINEVSLQTGKLNSTGIKNLQAVNNLILSGVVPYEFETYEMPFECDATTLVVSEGRSMLGSEYSMKIVPGDQNQNQDSVSHTMTLQRVIESGEVAQLRTYLAACRALPFNIDDATKERCVSDYVEMRKQNPTAVTPETLDRLLTLGRFYSNSHGLSNLHVDGWLQVQKGEDIRTQRL
eukprot:CFRG6602T1